jgi:hypothetical protein
LPLLALSYYHLGYIVLYIIYTTYNGAFTLDVKLELNENVSGILGVTQCEMGDSLMFKWMLA